MAKAAAKRPPPPDLAALQAELRVTVECQSMFQAQADKLKARAKVLRARVAKARRAKP